MGNKDFRHDNYVTPRKDMTADEMRKELTKYPGLVYLREDATKATQKKI